MNLSTPPVPTDPLTLDAFNACADRHGDALFRFLARHVRDRELARDLVQESLMRLWMRRDAVEAGRARSYLYATAIHALISHMRRQRRLVRWEPGLEPEAVGRSAEPDVRHHLKAGFQRLPAAQRKVVMLRDLCGHTNEEVASITGLSAVQVKVYLHRGRKALRAYLGSPALLT